ncbi:hypothetical protein EXN66_Car021238 [Channa argus]|uniref:Uncharacterized protein n=1 Tax=Channa argus TaxID=215402 RepID=A0A6G1QSU4_CHAAH|nr:hypothetical protein EXN66_Car021238 [Channa argus]
MAALCVHPSGLSIKRNPYSCSGGTHIESWEDIHKCVKVADGRKVDGGGIGARGEGVFLKTSCK